MKKFRVTVCCKNDWMKEFVVDANDRMEAKIIVRDIYNLKYMSDFDWISAEEI